VLKKFNYFDALSVGTSYDPSTYLKKNKGPSASQSEYAKTVRSVILLMNYTQPDIAYALSQLSRYTHNSSKEHWDALFHLLKYLRGVMVWCLHFSKFSIVLEGFCNANWVFDEVEVSSTSSYIARSIMEAEFITLELAGQ